MGAPHWGGGPHCGGLASQGKGSRVVCRPTTSLIGVGVPAGGLGWPGRGSVVFLVSGRSAISVAGLLLYRIISVFYCLAAQHPFPSFNNNIPSPSLVCNLIGDGGPRNWL